MSYLSRETSTLPEQLWEQIDAAVVGAARGILTGRRFLHLSGPLGIGVQSVAVDEAGAADETASEGVAVTKGRAFREIPLIYDDFTLLARDLESAGRSGLPADLSRASAAAVSCALKEDRLIFFGNPEFGYEGLLTAKGVNQIGRKDWSAGENAFSDIAAALELLTEKSIYGTYALVVSPDLYLQMQRLQPGTGLLEIDRVAKLLEGRVYRTPVLGRQKAVLVCSEENDMDLVVGQDMATAYLEQKELNHSFRVLETVLLRIRRREAIVVFE